MFVIHYHNEHAFDNPGECAIYGPYQSLKDAKVGLVKLVTEMNDADFKIDPEPGTDADGTYAGFNYEELDLAERDEDLCSEIWAEIVELTEM